MLESRSDEKLDRIVEALHEVNVNLGGLQVTLTGLVEVTNDHETRLRVIERWQNNLMPILAAMTFVLGVTFTEVIDRLL